MPMSPDAIVDVSRRTCASFLAISLCLAACPCSAATLDEAQKLFNTGEYDDCITACGESIEQNQWHLAWRLLKIKAELATGRYTDALATYEAAMARYSS